MQARHRNDEQYFEELAGTARRYILPFIRQHKPVEAGMRVLEIGCGVGGNLQAFRELGCVVHGIDIAASKIDIARRLLDGTGQDPTVNLSCQDFLTMPSPAETFDWVFIHDVIEHITDKDAFMERLKAFVRPDSLVYFAFPAWQMPFGGHQQICRSRIASRFPFLHLLPTPLYRAFLKAVGEQRATIDELLDIQRCKTPIERFRKLLRRHGYTLVREQLYLINPHYEAKFDLRPRKLPRWIAALPWIRNFFSTSCFYLIRIAR
jgi:SAM-dependent methyltransferase